MIRYVKMALIAAVIGWAFIGAFGNLSAWGETTGAVQAVTTMVTFEDGARWKATSNPVIVWAGGLFIMLSKLACGILCAVALPRMWQARDGNAAAFSAAKQLAVAGCAIAVFMLFGGFIVIAEGWFELWRSQVMMDPVLGGAMRYILSIGTVMIFVNMADE